MCPCALFAPPAPPQAVLTWRAVANHPNEARVLAFLATGNITRGDVDLTAIAWRFAASESFARRALDVRPRAHVSLLRACMDVGINRVPLMQSGYKAEKHS